MARIITLGGRQWVAGLDWNSYSEKPDRMDLETFAETHSYDWVAVRTSETVIQAGFCAPIDGIKRPRRLPSLAAFLADSHEQPWIGIYQISEGLWWYIAVRDGHAILPDGDIIGGRDEISQIRVAHSGFGDWNYLEGTVDDLIERIKTIKARPTNLKSIKYRGPTVIQLACSAFAATAIVGTCAYFWYQNQMAIEKEKEIAAARVRAQLAAGEKIQPVKSPLLESPEPNPWLKSCKNVVYGLPLSAFGWSIDKITCESSIALVTWKRQLGATVESRPEGIVSDDGEIIVQTIQLETVSNALDDNSIEIHSALLKLRGWAQSADITLTVKNDAQALPGAESADPHKAIPQQRFSMDMKVSPFGLDFSSIPGLRIKSIQSINDFWHVEGVVYGR